MDSREDEQLRGITMKSSAISLLFTKGNVYLHAMTVGLQFMLIMLNRLSVPLSDLQMCIKLMCRCSAIHC